MSDPTSPAAGLPASLQLTRRILLGFYYALIAYFAVAIGYSLGELSLNVVLIWALLTLPLWLFAWGLHHNHLRSYGWLSLVVLLYFVHAVLLSFDSGRRWLGLLEVLLTTGLFVVLMVYIRQFRRHFGTPL